MFTISPPQIDEWQKPSQPGHVVNSPRSQRDKTVSASSSTRKLVFFWAVIKGPRVGCFILVGWNPTQLVVGPRPLDGRGVFCTRWMLRNWSGVGGGGGWSHSLHLHTCWMLRNWSGVGGGGMITFLALAHMLDAAQLVRGGWGGGITLLALAHMLDATQLVRGGWGGWSHSLHLHTCWMLRNWSGGWGGGDDHIPCTCTHVGCCATGQGWVGGGWSHFLHLHTCWMLRNWSGMITFLALAHMLDATQLVGDDRIPCTCTHVGCYATGRGWSHFLHLHTCWMLRNWSGMITFLALAHMLDATQLVGDDHIPCTCTHVGCYATGGGWSHFLHLHTCWMLRNWSGMITFLALAHTLDATQLVGDDHISCTCTHVGCCATGRGWSHFLHLHTCWMLRNWSGMITFLALAHMLDATQLVGDDHIPCTCTHVGCYATGRGWSHFLHLHTCWMLRNWSGMITFLALAHTLDATQLVGDDHISCTCTHVGCYATGRGWSHSLHLHTRWMLRNWSGMITFLALAHMLDATQLVGDDHISCTCTHVGCYATGRGWSHFLHLHTCWMLRNWWGMITFLALAFVLAKT